MVGGILVKSTRFRWQDPDWRISSDASKSFSFFYLAMLDSDEHARKVRFRRIRMTVRVEVPGYQGLEVRETLRLERG